MRSLLIVLLGAFHCIPVFSQDDNVGAGHSLHFDGINDYVDVGNAYDNLTYPFTVSAWVYMPPPPSGGPIMVTQDNDALYNGFWFYVTPTVLYLEYGDGMGGDNPAFRSGKAVNMTDMSGRWNHVCAVVKGAKNIDLYINGSKPAGAYETGESNSPMASNYPGAPASIGHFLSNGIHYYFKGDIDDVRIFDRELSETEIRNQMCRKLAGNETGLIGYWPMDETTGTAVNDKSSNHFNGQFKNTPARVFSGAPIGDQSKFLYTTSWTGKSLYMDDQNDSLVVTNIRGNPLGVQIYEVQDLPSQQNGLDLSSISQPYFGVFIAGMDNDNQFDARYYYNGGEPCSVFKRNDNSVPDWLTSDDILTDQPQQTELIRSSDGAVNLDLGPDMLVCDQSSSSLTTGITTPGVSFTWNTGQNTAGITINQSGSYWVEAQGSCGTGKDTITVTFGISPEDFYLGADQFICDQSSYLLETGINRTDVSISWNTGQNTDAITVSQSGEYWANVENSCGIERDTIVISFGQSPQSFSLGIDEEWCELKTITLKPFTDPTGYSFTWQDGSKQSTFQVEDYGIYWVTVENACGSVSDSVTFSKSDIEFVIPNVITPNGDALNQYFKIDERLEGPFSLEIFNRWGSQVFHSDAYANNWDGTGLSSGVYFYRIIGGCIGEKIGSVSILR